jgi:serine/threonine protein kinase
MEDTDRSAGAPIAHGPQLGDEMIGLEIAGELTIEHRLAEGGMGDVFVAMQKSTGKRRAVKLMHRQIARDPDFLRRFVQEARVGARIRSEHIVETLAAGVDAATGLPYLVMELLEGEDLRHRIQRGPLSIEETRTVLEQLCHAMTAGHSAGVVHRDLKPENVFLQRARRAGAGALTVKVLDFGIAKLLLEANTRATRGAVGSPLWMAPEQTAPGPVTASADVWAIGLIAYEMLVGKSFWRTGNQQDGNTVQLLREIVLEPLPSASARAAEYGESSRLPPGFDAWFSRCVCREPSERFQDAAALWRSLPPLLASTASSLEATGEAFPATITATARETNALSTKPGPALSENTGAATPFVASHGPTASTPPEHSPHPAPRFDAPRFDDGLRVRPETPIATVHEPAALAATTPPRGDPRVVVAGAIAIVSLAVAVFAVARSSAPGAGAVTPPGSATGTIAAQSSATISLVPSLVMTPAASATASTSASSAGVGSSPASPPIVASTSPATPKATAATRPKPLDSGGFTDPSDRDGSVTWNVQGRHVRLLVRLVSNDSDVADAVVRRAIEHASWEYLRCYERAFAGAKLLPEATVNVGFDILDQLPRHANLVSSTSASSVFNDCVVGTLLGRTIGTASRDATGHAVEEFRFVPN